MADIKLFSDRIIFRIPQLYDANDILKHFNWDVIKNISNAPWPFTLQNARSFIEDAINDSKSGVCYEFVLIEKLTNNFIGIASLNVAAKGETPGQIGYWIGSEFRRKGFALEAVKEIMRLAEKHALKKVWATARHDNLPSINLLKKAGMLYSKEQIGVYEGKEMPEVLYEMYL